MILRCESIDNAVTRAAPFIQKGYRVKETSTKHIELEATPRANLKLPCIILLVTK